MSKLLNVENGAVYEGYDSLAAAEWCSPSFLGCGICVSASAVKGQVTITIGLKTPFGNVTKSFNFNANVSYTWQPFSKFKITVSITNFNEAGGVFSFDLGLNPCIDVPFLGWKCFNYSHHFVVPIMLHGIQSEIDDSQFSSILALHAGGSLGGSCNDCGDQAGSPLLQGDIYSNYLKNNANIPTLPVSQCVPTVQCVPTLSCIPTASCTGIPFICSAEHGVGANASNAAAFPTIPITQCLPIPTVQCIPTITSCVTGISPICLAQQGHGANASNAAAFPTIPITQCLPIPTVQCIPTITSCVTGISPICLAQQGQHGVGGSAANAAAFPTIPITQCLPIPTVQCVPTITSCITGISPICLAQQGQHGVGGNAAAVPTLPVNQCVPTVQCVPTLSCIPTVSCTGIPFIC